MDAFPCAKARHAILATKSFSRDYLQSYTREIVSVKRPLMFKHEYKQQNRAPPGVPTGPPPGVVGPKRHNGSKGHAAAAKSLIKNSANAV